MDANLQVLIKNEIDIYFLEKVSYTVTSKIIMSTKMGAIRQDNHNYPETTNMKNKKYTYEII